MTSEDIAEDTSKLPIDTTFRATPRVQSPNKPGLIVVEHVYHLRPDNPPATITLSSESVVKSDEETWRRTQKVGETPVRISLGWLEEVGNCPGMLILENTPPKRVGTPSPDHIAEDAAKTVLLGFTAPENNLDDTTVKAVIEIPPGESCRFRFTAGKTVWVQCISGETRINVFCVPR